MIETITELRDPLEDTLGYQLRRASAVMMAELSAKLLTLGQNPTAATILLVIRANPGCKQSDVARLLGIKGANIVPLIAGLLDGDLVVRSPVDGRSHALHLSPAGEIAADSVRTIVEAHERRFAAALVQADRPGLMDALRTIRKVRAGG